MNLSNVGQLKEDYPKPEEFNKDLFKDLPDSDQKDTGHADIFRGIVDKNLNEFKNLILQQPVVNSMDNNLISIIDETKDKIKGAITTDTIYDVFANAIKKIKSDSSAFSSEYSQGLINTFNQLLKDMDLQFTSKNEDITRPTIIAMVKKAFDLGPYPDFQTYPLGFNSAPSETQMASPVEDNKEMTKNEEPPIPETVTTDPLADIAGMMDDLHTNLWQSKEKLNQAYQNAWDLKADPQMKTMLMRQIDKLNSKLKNVMEHVDGIHTTIRKLK